LDEKSKYYNHEPPHSNHPPPPSQRQTDQGASAAGVPAAEKEERMVLKNVQTDQAPAAIGPYVQAIVAGPLRFVSGQLGLIPQTGELAGSDLASQARQALQNLKQIVVAAGCALDEVAAVDVFLTDMGKFAEFNQIYEEFFTGHRPARAVVEVSALPKGALVEVKCVAYAGA
jgi:2-iminobutanoate/2-iminopropanoate deaminase